MLDCESSEKSGSCGFVQGNTDKGDGRKSCRSFGSQQEK